MDFNLKQKLNNRRILELRSKATPSEIQMQGILERAGVKNIFQKGFIKGDAFVIVDFYIKRGKVCLEVDGEYHETPEQKSYDAWKDAYLRSRGFRVIRVKNEEVGRFNPVAFGLK